MLKNIAIAGIFDRFHIGHQKTIDYALEHGEKLYIFILESGDNVTHPDKLMSMIQPFEERLTNVRNYIKKIKAEDRVEIADRPNKAGLPPLFGWEIFRDLDELGWVQCQADREAYERFGFTFDYIRKTAYNKPPLTYYWIPEVLDEEGNKVSASAIRRKELTNVHSEN